MMRPVVLLVVCAIGGVVGGCGEKRTGPTPAQQNDRDAERVVAELEPRISTARALPPEERMRAEQQLGDDLERAAAEVAGTALENKVLYWLAAWRLEYAAGAGVDDALDRLDACRLPKLKGFGEYLRVQHRLRQGDTADAKRRATALIERIPEFQSLSNQVWLYEQIGRPPPRTSGQSIAGGADDPASAREQPWLVYLFVDVLNAEGLHELKRYVAEIARLEYAGKVRAVLVTSEGTPLNALAKVRTVPGGSELDVLWASPAEGGDAGEWRKAWNLAPRQNANVLLGPGPKRVIMAILSRPEELRAITGN
ncbi:MAG: hypothetical protein H0V44_14440 [Planctomycetes bacterium]|nr:hypothetical protein [Planctomycetota bacterium]